MGSGRGIIAHDPLGRDDESEPGKVGVATDQ